MIGTSSQGGGRWQGKKAKRGKANLFPPQLMRMERISRSLPDRRGDEWSRQRRWSERRNNVGRT